MPHVPPPQWPNLVRRSHHEPLVCTNTRDAVISDAKNELVDFIVHQAFYPVLMADRSGPNKAVVEQLQSVTRAEIERFRSCKSLKEVIENFERNRQMQLDTDLHADLKVLSLPVLSDLQQGFERKVYELGLARKTVWL